MHAPQSPPVPQGPSPGHRPDAAQGIQKENSRGVMMQAQPVRPVGSGGLEPDRMVRLFAADDYQVHRLVYALFARDGVRDFLFSSVAVSGSSHQVLVRRVGVATCFREGQQFDMELRAMPSVKRAGRRRSIGAARAKDSLRLRWLGARAKEHGFELRSAPEMWLERIRLEQAKTPFAVNACIYRARVRVIDSGRFARAYTRGVGQGRAWGCGMMILGELDGSGR